MKLLVVDHDHTMVEMITSWLKAIGYEVHPAYSGEQAKIKWEEHQPDIVILDSALQDVDSITIYRDLQSKYDSLVIVMSEEKGVRDEVQYLEAGADSYLRKPFFPDQLLAHIHTVARRQRSTLKDQQVPILRVGPIQLDSLHHQVRVRDKVLRLTPTESKLLYLLCSNMGRVCTLDQIVRYVWDFTNTGVSGLVKSHIYNLRQKIEVNPQNPDHIITVPNVGYMFAVHQDHDLSNRKEEPYDQLEDHAT